MISRCWRSGKLDLDLERDETSRQHHLNQNCYHHIGEHNLIHPQIAVQFWYEHHDANGQWYRTYGLEDWTFATDGRMAKRMMSANDVAIEEGERWFKDGVDVDSVEISEKHW